jgi:hypothetical protein
MSGAFLTDRAAMEALAARAASAGYGGLPLIRASIDLGLGLVAITHHATPWPADMIARLGSRPTCVLIAADPGYGSPDPAPDQWACAHRLKYWAKGAAIHGAAGEPDHYRRAAMAALSCGRLAFIETTSNRAREWAAFLGCPRTLLWVPASGAHPVRGTLQ